MQDDITSQDFTALNSVHQGKPSEFWDAIFARRLRAIREQARMTQQDLAEWMAKTGNKFHRSTIAKIEAGDRLVTVGEALELAGILGVDLQDVLIEYLDPSEEARLHAEHTTAMLAFRSAQHDAIKKKAAFEAAKGDYDKAGDILSNAAQKLAFIENEMAERGM